MEFGTGATAIGLLKTLYGLYKDFAKWTEEERSISFDWIRIAKEKGVLDPRQEYALVRPDRVETCLLEETQDLVYEYDESKRIKYKLVIKASSGQTSLVLMAKKK